MIDEKLLSFGEVKELVSSNLGPAMLKLDTDTFNVISKNKETLEALINVAFENAQNLLIAQIAELAMENSKQE